MTPECVDGLAGLGRKRRSLLRRARRLKRFQHPLADPLTLEYSAIAVDGAEGLGMVVFTPAAAADARAIALLLADQSRTP